MSVAWALLWLAFSLFVDAELIYDAVMSNTFLVSALTFLPISAMFFVERKLRTMYANPQSSSFGHVLLMFSRTYLCKLFFSVGSLSFLSSHCNKCFLFSSLGFFGAFAIYMIMRIVYFPMIFPDTYKVAEVVETVVADAAASL